MKEKNIVTMTFTFAMVGTTSLSCELFLTHIDPASHFWYLGTQCRPRSDAAEWSGSTLFANKNINQKYNKNKKYTRHPYNWKWTHPNW